MGLDGVELVMAVEEEFGITISDAEAETIMTPKDLIGIVCEKVDLSNGDVDAGQREAVCEVIPHCRSQRAFHKIRKAISESTGSQRRKIRLDTELIDLFTKPERSRKWKLFKELSGLHMFSSPGSWLRIRPAPQTVRGLVDRLVALNLAPLNVPGSWSQDLARDLVRKIVYEQLGVSEFDDDDEFARDMGMD
jgi:acyl carrier protein